jgi:RNase adaptor protein for sRNA GlmZ degradation
MDNAHQLKVSVNSFSYKQGIPEDPTGNGGGFVFDCRGVLNPGRYERYMDLTGKDPEVIDFFKKNSQIDDFLEKVLAVVEVNVKTYIEREFTDLMVNFGCTGGQHRSVYCAERFAKLLKERYPVEVSVTHHEID